MVVFGFLAYLLLTAVYALFQHHLFWLAVQASPSHDPPTRARLLRGNLLFTSLWIATATALSAAWIALYYAVNEERWSALIHAALAAVGFGSQIRALHILHKLSSAVRAHQHAMRGTAKDAALAQFNIEVLTPQLSGLKFGPSWRIIAEGVLSGTISLRVSREVATVDPVLYSQDTAASLQLAVNGVPVPPRQPSAQAFALNVDTANSFAATTQHGPLSSSYTVQVERRPCRVCAEGFVWQAQENRCVRFSATWTTIARSDGTVRLDEAVYQNGLGAVSDANYVADCDTLASFGNNFVLRVAVDGQVQYFRPLPSVTNPCAMLLGNTQYRWSPSLDQGFVALTPYQATSPSLLGGNAPHEVRGVVGLAFAYFWGVRAGATPSGACCGTDEVFSWWQPLQIDIASVDKVGRCAAASRVGSGEEPGG